MKLFAQKVEICEKNCAHMRSVMTELLCYTQFSVRMAGAEFSFYFSLSLAHSSSFSNSHEASAKNKWKLNEYVWVRAAHTTPSSVVRR